MRVTAMESMKNGVCKIYGHGELIEGTVPNTEPFKKHKIKNPCIKLDNGKYVWGFQCWWGEYEKTKSDYLDKATEVIEVKPDEYIDPYYG